jgi:hypothetical protein
MYREGLNSSKPHYRLLCFYRVHEGLLALQHRNTQSLRVRGLTPKRTVRRVPSNDLTKKFFPTLVGKKLGEFFDYVRERYRVPIAHLETVDLEKIILDPANVRIEHVVDATNAVLEVVLAQLVTDEWELMDQHELGRES